MATTFRPWNPTQFSVLKNVVRPTQHNKMSIDHSFIVSDTILERVIIQLNYTSRKSFEEDVATVKKWLREQPHFPEIMDDKRIQNFLILNKGSVERTKKKIDNYYTVRSHLPQIFDDAEHKVAQINHVLDACYVVPLPKLTKDMCRVLLYKTKCESVLKNFDPIAGTRYLVNSQEVRLLEDVMYGDIFVIDGQDVPLSFVLQLTPAAVYAAIATLYERVYSSRMKALYIVNAPPFADKILFLVKAVLRPKLVARIHFLDNYDQLIDHLGKEVVPKDYGGDERSVAELQDITKQKLEQYKEYLNKLDRLRVNEELRPKELRNDEMLGFHGHFKKLEID